MWSEALSGGNTIRTIPSEAHTIRKTAGEPRSNLTPTDISAMPEKTQKAGWEMGMRFYIFDTNLIL